MIMWRAFCVDSAPKYSRMHVNGIYIPHSNAGFAVKFPTTVHGFQAANISCVHMALQGSSRAVWQPVSEQQELL